MANNSVTVLTFGLKLEDFGNLRPSSVANGSFAGNDGGIYARAVRLTRREKVTFKRPGLTAVESTDNLWLY